MNTDSKASTQLQTDQVAKTDTLERKRFAEKIAYNILSHFECSTESLVIGIHGPWGSGKSTLLDLIRKELDGSVKAGKQTLHIVPFNPWMFSGKEHLQWSFLNELAVRLGKIKGRFKKRLQSLAAIVQGAAQVSLPVAIFYSIVKKYTYTPIDQVKEEINNLLVSEKVRLVILVDDLDRLAPSEILEVFQLVKLNANFSNTIFLMAFDKLVVTNAIKNEFKQNGEQYLEKIIQVDFNIPAIMPEDLESMFFSKLKTLLQAHQIDFDPAELNSAWLIHGLRHYFTNIRNFNRYFNSLEFRLPAIHQDVNIHDFLLLEAIRLFDYKSFEIIQANYKARELFGVKSVYQTRLLKIQKRKSWSLYDYAFQETTYQLKDMKYRMRNPEFCDRYFSLAVSKRDVREEEYLNFIRYPETRTELLTTSIKNDKIEYLLRRLSIKPDSSHDNLLQVILPMLDVWDNYANAFAKHWREVWRALKMLASTHAEAQYGFKYLLNEISRSPSQFSPSRFMYLWLLLENIHKRDDKNIDKDMAAYSELIESQRNKLENAFKLTITNFRTHILFNDLYDPLYSRVLITALARYDQTVYTEHFKQLVDHEERWKVIVDLLVFKDAGGVHSLNKANVTLLLPGHLKDILLKRLRKVNRNLLSGIDSMTVEYIITYLD
jgi:hypothetical protein